jgi:hypothetical protein
MPPAKDQHSDSFTAPAVLWLAVQISVLALAAARIPLWARFDPPFERWALHLLAAAEVAVASLMFPWLMRSTGSSLFTIVFAIPSLGLAALLAQAGAEDLLMTSGAVVVWLLSLALWRRCLRSELAQLFAAAVASCTTLGGGVLLYLGTEFSNVFLRTNKCFSWLAVCLVVNLLLAATCTGFSRQVIHRQPSTSPPAHG